jgi:hypothetical protein
MVSAVCAEQALAVPATLFGNVDTQTVQQRALLNLEITTLRKWPDVYWTKLKKEWSFTTLAADVQPSNALPPDTDFDHFINSSMWDRTLVRPVVGPISPQLWEAWKARPVLTSVVFGFILRGNDFLTAPNPPAGDSVHYEYISQLCVYSAGTATTPDQQLFAADADTCIFPTNVVQQGLRWRFLRAKGLSYEQEYADWINMVQIETSRQGGMPMLSMAGSYNDWLAGPYVPQFNWPGP